MGISGEIAWKVGGAVRLGSGAIRLGSVSVVSGSLPSTDQESRDRRGLPSECGLGCPRSVVTHAKTNIRAVCNEKEGPAIQLSPRQTLIYRLKQSAINGAICVALGIEHRESKLDGLPHTWRLGDFIPTAGMDFPVVLTMQDSKDALAEVVRSLCLSTIKPFVLIAPHAPSSESCS